MPCHRRYEHEFDIDWGDDLVAAGVRANFVPAKVVSTTGGSGVTVQILG